MRILPSIFIIVSLLFQQISGMHLHMSAGNVEGMHSNHGSHQNDAHHDQHHVAPAAVHDDHRDERDVSLFEFSISAEKLFAIVAYGIALYLLARLATSTIKISTSRPQPLRRRLHWRPPLRGPPSFLSDYSSNR